MLFNLVSHFLVREINKYLMASVRLLVLYEWFGVELERTDSNLVNHVSDMNLQMDTNLFVMVGCCVTKCCSFLTAVSWFGFISSTSYCSSVLPLPLFNLLAGK